MVTNVFQMTNVHLHAGHNCPKFPSKIYLVLLLVGLEADDGLPEGGVRLVEVRGGEGDGRALGQGGAPLAGRHVHHAGLEAGEAVLLQTVAGVGLVPGLGVRVPVATEGVPVECSAVQCSTVQYSTVQCSAVPGASSPGRDEPV